MSPRDTYGPFVGAEARAMATMDAIQDAAGGIMDADDILDTFGSTGPLPPSLVALGHAIREALEAFRRDCGVMVPEGSVRTCPDMPGVVFELLDEVSEADANVALERARRTPVHAGLVAGDLFDDSQIEEMLVGDFGGVE